MNILRIKQSDGSLVNVPLGGGGGGGVHIGDRAPTDGSDVWLDTSEESNPTTGETYNIPKYWDTPNPEAGQPANYLSNKIEAIKDLHKQFGRNCFSFILMADNHYYSNLGKRSPIIAKKIADECDIKYVICAGDTQTRGCWNTKDELLAENVKIEEFLKPIAERLLRTEGNHDGAYGRLDKDGDGSISNNKADGSIKDPIDRETYVNNLTLEELHQHIYRKVGMVGNVHFDETGTAYYIDDTSNNVRYIGLNTQYNKYELLDNGTVKYPKMWLFRFTQPQFDFLINEALVNGVTDKTNIVVFGHCPLWQEIGDADVMIGVLNAYKNKTTYSGTYAGTAEGGPAYKNLAEPLPNNTTDTTKWVNGYRISSTAISAQSGKTVTNPIYRKDGTFLKVGDVIRVKGVSFGSEDRFMLAGKNSAGVDNSQRYYVSALPNSVLDYSFENGIHTFTVLYGSIVTDCYIRFAFDTPTNPDDVIITVNEPIVEGSVSGYDAVSVNCDFSNAKGNLVGYFAGHVHSDHHTLNKGFPIITTRCDAPEENDSALLAQRIKGTVTEQSFDVFTIDTTNKKIYATKIGTSEIRDPISYK